MRVFGQLERAQIEVVGALPTGADAFIGRIVYLTTDQHIYIHDGTGWEQQADEDDISGSANYVAIYDGSGDLSEEQYLDKTRGGTGITSTATFPASGVVVTEDGTSILTNKTFDADGAGNSISNIEDADIKVGAAVARTKLANGTANHVLINDGSGVMSSEAILAVSRGGTGSSSQNFVDLTSTQVITSGTKTFGASAELNMGGALLVNGIEKHAGVASSAATGASAVLPSTTSFGIRVTNASLTSIAGITSGGSGGYGRLIVLTNGTGADITIENDNSGVDGILTGKGANILLNSQESILLYYVASTNRWHIVNPSLVDGSPVGTTDTQTLTNKTIVATSNTISALADTNFAAAGVANVARDKLASGTANHVVINDGSGVLSSEATLAISRGGTGSATRNFVDLTSNEAVGGNKTFNGTTMAIQSALTVSGAAKFSNLLELSYVENSSPTGADQTITVGGQTCLKYSNASLTSIAGFVGTISNNDGRTLVITNGKGSGSIVIKNEAGAATAANRIVTGTGTDLTLQNGASVILIYDTSVALNRWRVIGGSGGGGGSFVTTATQSVAAAGTVTTTTTDGFQMRRVDSTGGAVVISATPFGAGGGWADGTVVRLVGQNDTNTVELQSNDAAKGAILNGAAMLSKFRNLTLQYDSVADRWVETGRNF